MHKPWSGVKPQKGLVPARWVRPLHRSPDLLPYRAPREPPGAIVPVNGDHALLADPSGACRFWTELDALYDAHRGHGSSTPRTLIARYDYARNLSTQPMRRQKGRRMVLHPAAADIMRAARTHAGAAVVESTLYWLAVDTEAEAG